MTPSTSFSDATTSTALVLGLAAREVWAERALLEKYTRHVERVVARITGDTSAELDDRVQEVFIRVMDKIGAVRDPESLPGFVTQVAVFVAREALRAKRRRGWLSFFAPTDLPEAAAPTASDEVLSAVAAFYKLVDRLEPDERIAFLLRHVEEMELTEVAAACDVSLATIKRRLASAERSFKARAVDAPDLKPWISGSRKWARAN